MCRPFWLAGVVIAACLEIAVGAELGDPLPPGPPKDDSAKKAYKESIAYPLHGWLGEPVKLEKISPVTKECQSSFGYSIVRRPEARTELVFKTESEQVILPVLIIHDPDQQVETETIEVREVSEARFPDTQRLWSEWYSRSRYDVVRVVRRPGVEHSKRCIGAAPTREFRMGG